MFLVRPGGQDQPVLQLDAIAFQDANRHQLRREQPFAVRCAPPEYAAVRDGRAERREPPLGLVLHRDHVGVGHEHQAGVARASLQPRNQVSTVGSRLQDLRLDAVFGQEVSRQFAHRRLVARRHEPGVHRRDAHQRLFQSDDVIFGLVNLVEKVG